MIDFMPKLSANAIAIALPGAHPAPLESPTPTIAAMPEKFAVIAVEPPWAFKTYSGKTVIPHRRFEGNHYNTMSMDALRFLPIPDYAAKDCALLMWVVDSHLDKAIELGKSWGFEYKTIAFVWVKTAKSGKPRMSMGYYTRKGAEICLLFTRGKPKRKSKGVRQVIMEPRREHSRKPDIYPQIEALFDGPYLEIFARQAYPGWHQIGNETTKFEVRGQGHGQGQGQGQTPTPSDPRAVVDSTLVQAV